MDETMKRHARHDVDKQGRDLVEVMEHERVTPHDDGHSVVAEGQAVGCDEQALRGREDPETRKQ